MRCYSCWQYVPADCCCLLDGVDDLFVLQTLSFLTYVLRGYAQQMQKHQDNLVACVLLLLLNCPPEPAQSRKVRLLAFVL